MRTKRVQTNPGGILAVLHLKPGQPPVLHLNADLVSDRQAAELGRRIAADPDLRAALGLA
ncbi:hypothetical protein [Kitasatospora cineracea]|uniref:hypothetical protein n=1 Tax=Kitasatospora cineracea TaxID=88074 RepID=UPI0037B22D45